MKRIGFPSFVDPSHVNSFHLSPKGERVARQIMCVIEHSCPDIISAPLLFPLTCLLLHFMDAPQSYSCVYALLRHSNAEFLPTTKVSFEASKLVIRDLAKKYAVSK